MKPTERQRVARKATAQKSAETEMIKMLDTRQYRRTREVPAKYIINGEEAKVFNVSEGGALIEKVIGTFQVGDAIDGKFVLDGGKEVAVSAKVLRVQERSIAIRFNENVKLPIPTA